MKLLIALLATALQAAAAQSIVVAWTPNTETNVIGYRVYHGSKPGAYDNIVDVKVPTATITNLAKGENFIAVTAYDAGGLESDFSAEAFYVLPTPPKPPTDVRLTYRILSARSMAGPWTNVAMTDVVIPIKGAKFFRGQMEIKPEAP
jgi:hypothetical protein